MIFEWKISIGNLVSLMSVLVGGLLFVFTIKADLQVITVRVAQIESTNSKIGDVLITLARQDERLSTIEKNINAK